MYSKKITDGVSNSIAKTPAGKFLIRMVGNYPFRTFGVMGLIGDGLVTTSGYEFNHIRLAAGLAGVGGCVVAMVFGDRQAKTASADGIDHQDRKTSLLRRVIDPVHYPMESSFAFGMAKSALLMVAGGTGHFFDAKGMMRPLEVVTAITDGAAPSAGYIPQIAGDTPLSERVIDVRRSSSRVVGTLKTIVPRTVHAIRKNPPLVSSLLFHVGGLSYLASGVMARDPWAASAGAVYTLGNLSLGWASKRAAPAP